jgi:hypothetical protein
MKQRIALTDVISTSRVGRTFDSKTPTRMEEHEQAQGFAALP